MKNISLPGPRVDGMRHLSALLLGIILLLSGCYGRFSYQHRYVGDFTFHCIASNPSNVNAGQEIYDFDGQIYLGDFGDLVLHFAEEIIAQVSVDRNGKMLFSYKGAQFPEYMEGSFTDKDHCSFIYTRGTWAQDVLHMEVTGKRR